jgi:benzoyl-CoA reductase/2-hydroxyglutaryl-CoA dehydratase subunit BcrC/BadD/HgdB
LKKIGITTTIPQEILYAAGIVPVDLNNIFINHPKPLELIRKAEIYGFPASSCAWVKGIYSAAGELGLKAVIAVIQGDCSNTHALMEVLKYDGVETIPFSYPYQRDREFLQHQLQRLRKHFGVRKDQAEEWKKKLDRIRSKALEVDRQSWQDKTISGFDNHRLLISCSDMEGNPEQFEAKLNNFLEESKSFSPAPEKISLGYVGVPPIFTDLYQFIESHGARIIYNETQRQFAMPDCGENLVEQYRNYTYPYDIFFRIEDIQKEAGKRKLRGIIHYVQSFCFRQIEDIILRNMIDIPVLTLEGDLPGRLDGRTKTRIESFIESLS